VNPAPAVLVHICGAEQWSSAQANGELRPESLDSAGFVHLSTPDQVHLPANRLFRGCGDLVLLHVDPTALEAPVRWEPGMATDPEAMLFPHLYGPLPISAVIKVTRYRPGPDGVFPLVGSTIGESR
jgi:uncharacterized protein (DUF952 family)